jgi:hypothetical protein
VRQYAAPFTNESLTTLFQTYYVGLNQGLTNLASTTAAFDYSVVAVFIGAVRPILAEGTPCQSRKAEALSWP